jgi:hypothetical protein
MARKENSNSIASRLSRIELAEGTAYDLVRERLGVENMDYADAVEWIEETFELETSVGALVNFYRKHCTGFKAKRNREYAREIRDMFEKDPEINFSELTLQQIEQRAFEEAYAKDADIKDLQALVQMIGSSKKLQLEWEKLEVAKRRIELLEKKAAQADEASGVVGDGKLTAEQKDQRLKGLFGFGG